MVEGVLNLAGSVFSGSFVTQLEARIATRATARFVATRMGAAAIRSAAADFVPFVGWAIEIGSIAYAGYEIYNESQIAWNKLEHEIYDEADMAVFRMGFTTARARSLASSAGDRIRQLHEKYILIPSEVMPTVAAIDAMGIGLYGNRLTWDPAGAPVRRRQAIATLGGAGFISLADGSRLRGSWEEYPFASTFAPKPGALVRPAPLRENWIQGGFIRAAAMVQEFQVSETVLCYIL